MVRDAVHAPPAPLEILLERVQGEGEMAQKEETEMSVKDMMPDELPGSDFHERRACAGKEGANDRAHLQADHGQR